VLDSYSFYGPLRRPCRRTIVSCWIIDGR
jgi:hypothetical protein